MLIKLNLFSFKTKTKIKIEKNNARTPLHTDLAYTPSLCYPNTKHGEILSCSVASLRRSDFFKLRDPHDYSRGTRITEFLSGHCFSSVLREFKRFREPRRCSKSHRSVTGRSPDDSFPECNINRVC